MKKDIVKHQNLHIMMDHIADITDLPAFHGVLPGDMDSGLEQIARSYDMDIQREEPIDWTKKDVDDFICKALDNDQPVLFMDYYQMPSDMEIINNSSNDKIERFNLNIHWITITKFYQNKTDTRFAFSSWGERYSIDAKYFIMDGMEPEVLYNGHFSTISIRNK